MNKAGFLAKIFVQNILYARRNVWDLYGRRAVVQSIQPGRKYSMIKCIEMPMTTGYFGGSRHFITVNQRKSLSKSRQFCIQFATTDIPF